MDHKRKRFKKDLMPGCCVVVDRDSNIVFCKGNPDEQVISHSTLKLVQVLPVYLLGLDTKYGLTGEELTIMSSSHLGQPEHIQILSSLLNKTGIKEEDFILEKSSPAGRIAYQHWKNEDGVKRKIYHPCAGNHIAMMLAQRELTGSIFGYEYPFGDVQMMIYDLLIQLSGCKHNTICLKKDDCGVPTFSMPLKAIANLYRAMTDTETMPARSEIKNSIHNNINNLKKYSFYLEGDECLSTVVSSARELFGKTGNEGLFAVGNTEKKYGIAIKAYNQEWKTVVSMLIDVLSSLQYADRTLYSELKRIVGISTTGTAKTRSINV